MPQLTLRNLTFSYDSFQSPLLKGVDVSFPPGWTCVAGPNGCGKTTLLKLATGLLPPTLGSVSGSEGARYVEQTVDFPPEQEPLGRWGSILAVPRDWALRWKTLSPGERKRAQIASALAADPPALALDEPTNHVDQEARLLIATALEAYRGIGLLVTHDRELAARLCPRTFVLPRNRVLDLPLEEALSVLSSEDEARRKARRDALSEARRLDRNAKDRITDAEAARKNSKRGLAPKDSDGRARINLGRMTGRDAVAGRLRRAAESRAARAFEAASGLEAPGERKHGLTPRSGRSSRDFLARIGPWELPLGAERRLQVPSLILAPADRIAIGGPNGSGKTTLLRSIARELGQRGIPFALLPQDLGVEEGRIMLTRIKALDDRPLGELLSALYRLGSEPDLLLQSESPSPGELRKLVLAQALAEGAEAILADEPTNHLDLEGALAFETALKDYRGALLLVSHDETLSERLCSTRWRVSGDQLVPDR